MINWCEPWCGAPPTINRLAPAEGSELGAGDPVAFTLVGLDLPRVRIVLRALGRADETVFAGGTFFPLYRRGSSRAPYETRPQLNPFLPQNTAPLYRGHAWELRRTGGWPASFALVAMAEAGADPELGGPTDLEYIPS